MPVGLVIAYSYNGRMWKNVMPVDYLNRFRENLKFVTRNRGEKTRIAAKAGISKMYMSQLLLDGSNIIPSLSSALAICEATGFSIGEYLLLPTTFRNLNPGKLPQTSIEAFFFHLTEVLDDGPRGIKQIVAIDAGIPPSYISSLLKTARDGKPIDINLNLALAISQAIDVPLEVMCTDQPVAARR